MKSVTLPASLGISRNTDGGGPALLPASRAPCHSEKPEASDRKGMGKRHSS